MTTVLGRKVAFGLWCSDCEGYRDFTDGRCSNAERHADRTCESCGRQVSSLGCSGCRETTS